MVEIQKKKKTFINFISLDFITRVHPLVSDFSKIKNILKNNEFHGNGHNLCEGLVSTLQV